MRRTVLIAALVLISASAQAGQSRNLSLAGTSSHPPISAPLPPTQASVVAEAPPAPAPSQHTPAAVAAPAPVAVAPAAPAPVSAAPETGAAPVATAPVPPPLPATTAPAAPAVAAPATSEAPKYVERPAVAPATTDEPKFDDGKPSKRAERRHHRGNYWSAGRIMGELRRYGISYGYGGW
jgi:hypothetical protein